MALAEHLIIGPWHKLAVCLRMLRMNGLSEVNKIARHVVVRRLCDGRMYIKQFAHFPAYCLVEVDKVFPLAVGKERPQIVFVKLKERRVSVG